MTKNFLTEFFVKIFYGVRIEMSRKEKRSSASVSFDILKEICIIYWVYTFRYYTYINLFEYKECSETFQQLLNIDIREAEFK